MTKLVDTFSFSNLSDLRDFLNQFKTTDLSVVFPDNGDQFVLNWFEETLSDGSKVNNVSLQTR